MDIGALEMWYVGSKGHGVKVKGLAPLKEEPQQDEEEEEEEDDNQEVAMEEESGLGSVPGGLDDDTPWPFEEEWNPVYRRNRKALSLLDEDLLGAPNGTAVGLAGRRRCGYIRWHLINDHS